MRPGFDPKLHKKKKKKVNGWQRPCATVALVSAWEFGARKSGKL
jgi:hypothetical protein